MGNSLVFCGIISLLPCWKVKVTSHCVSFEHFLCSILNQYSDDSFLSWVILNLVKLTSERHLLTGSLTREDVEEREAILKGIAAESASEF